MSNQYQHIFFDLDHTLWDFERNSRETLQELVAEFHLLDEGVPSFEEFLGTYRKHNDALWESYRKGWVTKAYLRTARFRNTMQEFGIEEEPLADRFNDLYLERCPQRTALLPHTLELLDHLADRYQLHIITNGFEEVQAIKLEKSGLKPYFQEVVTSERAYARKPDPQIFRVALACTGAELQESLMVGDDARADMLGAKRFGMDQVWYNPEEQAFEDTFTQTVRSHRELITML